LAKSDPDGNFAAPITGPWPEYVVIASTGKGRMMVPILPAVAHISLGKVALPGGGAVEASIRGSSVPLDIRLFVRDSDDAWKLIEHRILPPSRRRVRFDDLATGVYQILIANTQSASEKLATTAMVAAGETCHTSIEIASIHVFGRVTLGDVPLSNAVVQLKHRLFQWQTATVADKDGLFHAQLWQGGTYSYSVRSSALATAYLDHVEIGSLATFHWTLTVPDRRIMGNVRDAATGSPVAGASLAITNTVGDTRKHRTAKADGRGYFDVAGMMPGSVSVAASASGYLDSAPAALVLRPGDRSESVDMTMEPGVVVPLSVTSAAGDPLPMATVITATEGHIRARSKTGEDGTAMVTIPKEPAQVYVIPRQGSFVAIAARDGRLASQHAIVPRPTSTLRIVTRTKAGQPLSMVSFLMRCNGVIVPPAVAEELFDIQGLPLLTNTHGEAFLRNLPAGFYEFWPYRGSTESSALMATIGGLLAPITVDVKTGDNSIAVNFDSR
jgi:hypothetical protein